MELIKNTHQLGLTKNTHYNNYINSFNKLSNGKPITDDLVESYFQFLKDKDYSPSSQQVAKVAIKRAVKDSLSLDKYQIDKLDVFFKNIKIDKPVAHIGEHKVISVQEIQRLIDNTTKKMSLMIKFLYNSGCRVSEALNIPLSKCKTSASQVVINVLGKGRKPRTVVVTEELFIDICNTFNNSDYLFQNHYSNKKKYSRQYITREIKKVSKQQLNKNISSHCLRHSRATHLLKQNESIEAVSKFLGHSKVSITYEIYAHNKIEYKKLVETGIS